MSESKESKRTSNPLTTAVQQPESGAGTTPEDAESRRANRNFLLWWIGLPLLIMLAIVLLRDRV